MPRQTVRVAAVDGPDQDHLKAVKVFEWDRTYDLVSPDHRKAGVLLRRLGLTRYPDRWVDVTDRPDIAENEPFPFHAPPEPAA
jgi:hypothetical protein